MMCVHGAMAGVVAYTVMTAGLGQGHTKALRRSVIAANSISTYMVIFGHKLPGQ